MWSSDESDWPNIVLLATRTQLARYPHECFCCHKPIKPNEMYTVHVEVVDGELSVTKFHGITVGECVATPEDPPGAAMEGYAEDTPRSEF